MGKINLKICCGIHCLVRGGQELLDLLEDHPEIHKQCDLECVKCLGDCEDGKNSPMIQIQEKFYINLTSERFLTLLQQEMSQD